MRFLAQSWLRFWADRRGVTALEYGLIASVLFATILVGFDLLADDLSSKFTTVGGSL